MGGSRTPGECRPPRYRPPRRSRGPVGWLDRSRETTAERLRGRTSTTSAGPS